LALEQLSVVTFLGNLGGRSSSLVSLDEITLPAITRVLHSKVQQANHKG
jgi:hypothetical protein